MTGKVHLTENDLAKLRRALHGDAVENLEISEQDEIAAGIDTAAGQARLDRLWTVFLTAAGSGDRADAVALDASSADNANTLEKRDLAEGIAYNAIAPFSSGAVDSHNELVEGLWNPIVRDEADGRARESANAPGQVVERITLVDGRVVTRDRDQT